MRIYNEKGYRLTMRDDEITPKIKNHVKRGVSQAIQFCVGKTRIKLNRSQPTRGVKGRNKAGATYRRVGLDPSEEGEPPKKVTARLFQSIYGRVVENFEGVVGYYGTSVTYGRRLELGFTGTDVLGRRIDQKPRPFLRPVLVENREEILRIVRNGGA